MQPAYGQTHAPCVVRREYVAEIARGNGEVHLFAHLYLTAAYEVEIGREIIGYLGSEAAEVYGICRGQNYVFVLEDFFVFLVLEDFFNGGLTVVEVAFYSNDVHV